MNHVFVFMENGQPMRHLDQKDDAVAHGVEVVEKLDPLALEREIGQLGLRAGKVRATVFSAPNDAWGRIKNRLAGLHGQPMNGAKAEALCQDDETLAVC